jgi:hypothetical protein
LGVKSILSFVLRSFWPKNSWGQLIQDNERFGRWGLLIAEGRSLLMLNGLVLPVTLFTNEKVRIVTIAADMILLPFLSVCSAMIAKHMDAEQKIWYSGKRLQFVCTSIGISYAAVDEVTNLLKGGFNRSHMFKPVAIVHNLLFPLFIRKYAPYLLAAFDRKIKMPSLLRVLTIAAIVATVAVLAYGNYEFFVEQTIS